MPTYTIPISLTLEMSVERDYEDLSDEDAAETVQEEMESAMKDCIIQVMKKTNTGGSGQQLEKVENFSDITIKEVTADGSNVDVEEIEYDVSGYITYESSCFNMTVEARGPEGAQEQVADMDTGDLVDSIYDSPEVCDVSIDGVEEA